MSHSNWAISWRWGYLLLGVAALSTSSTAQDLMQGRVVELSSYHRIAYNCCADEIRDPVVIGGIRYDFLFDTGAPLCISQRIQDAKRYPVISEAVLVDANARTGATTIVLVDTVRYGGSIFCDVPAVVLDLAHSPLAKAGVEGILGSNVLQHLVVRFDLQRSEILLSGDPVQVGWDPVLAVPSAIDAQGNFLMACRIGDQIPDTARFDTGSADLYTMDHAVVEANIAECTEEQLHQVHGRARASKGMMGAPAVKPKRYHTSSLRVGMVDLGPVDLVTTAAHSRLGRRMLQEGVLIINYPQRAYMFTPPGP